MVLETSCPHCATIYRNVPKEWVGKPVRCKKCSKAFRVEPPGKPDEPGEWKIGQVLMDLYEVTGLLGKGGMGKVYKVHHRGWDLDLAVKCPRLDVLKRAGGAENFEREATTWVNLGLHSHIVSCYYVRSMEGIPRVFAEYVAGGSLEQWIRQGKLYEGEPAKALEQMLDIAIQFAWGLHYAHEQKLVHQDVKPANVMMTTHGIAKVTDFGLARARPMESLSEEEGTMMVEGVGMTRQYASPEQASGSALSRRTDLWSWAVSVLEMFTGGPKWKAGIDAPAALEATLGQSSPSDGRIPPMPPALVDLLRKCFRLNPGERPHDMLAAANTIKTIYSQTTGRAYPRERPQSGKGTADSLNNRAVSLLDLGKREAALRLWKQAISVQPHHPEATFNRGLILWRAGSTNDVALLRHIEEIRRSHQGHWIGEYLMAWVHLERGDGEEALHILDNLDSTAKEQREIRAIMALTEESRAHSTQLWRTYRGHTDVVTSVVLSRPGRYALSGSRDKTLRLWEVETARFLRSFIGHRSAVTSVDISPDECFALSGSEDHTLRLWEIETGYGLMTFTGHKNCVSSVRFSQEGRVAISGSSDRTLKLWDVETGTCLRTFKGHSDIVTSVSPSTDCSLVLSGSEDHTLKLWHVESGECLHTMKGHQDVVTSVYLSSDGGLALSGSLDCTVKVWETASGYCVDTFEGHKNGVISVVLSPDLRFALSGGADRILKLWEMKTGRCLRSFIDSTAASVTCVTLSHDGRLALSGAGDRTIKLWAMPVSHSAPLMLSLVRSGENIMSAQREYEDHLEAARQALKRGNLILTAQEVRAARSQPGFSRGSDAMEIWGRLYRYLPKKGLLGAWEVGSSKGHKGGVTTAQMTGNGELALTGGKDGLLKLWRIESGQCIQILQGHVGEVTAACIRANGTHILSGGSDRKMMLWDGNSGRCIRVFEGARREVTAVALSKDVRFALAASRDGFLRMWDLRTGRCLREIEVWVIALALSADSRQCLMGCTDRSLMLWDVETEKYLRVFEGHSKEVTAVALSYNGRHAVSGGKDQKVILWDAQTGRCLHILEGHTDVVTCACISSNGRYALSSSMDKTFRLWDVSTGRCLRIFEGHRDGVSTIALSPDGRYVLSGSHDEMIKRWVLDWELAATSP